MKVLLSWLHEFVTPNVTSSELAHTLTMSGLEVDGVSTIAPAFTGVVVGEVVTCEKHPDADKLNLCTVNVGTKVSQIICGASNVRAGIKVAVATVGSVLPGNFKIKKAKLRGVESYGMICSESELGLTDSSEGILELDLDAPIGADIRQYLRLDDEIIDIDVTPNRGDCFSILGVAREVAVNYNLPLTTPKYNLAANSSQSVSASVLEPAHCPKYLVRSIKNIDNSAHTPTWMEEKLSRSGFALHSPVVDVTNFVLLELGQPMHVFDSAKIDTAIHVRLAHDNEQLELLNGDTTTIKPNTLVIADDNGALALAGIMGGMKSSSTEDTTSIILESAFFDAINIAGVAREHGLHTESSLRFERGVDFNLTEVAMHRATQLILEICGGEAGEITSCLSAQHLPVRNEVVVSLEKINSILGFILDKEWVIKTLTHLDFELTINTDTEIGIIPPSFRFDITVDVDLIEELARIYGYDKLPTKPLHIASSLQKKSTQREDILSALISLGYNEVVNYSFISKELSDTFGGNVELLNPISSDMCVMRGSLLGGLVKTALYNKRYGMPHLKIFETGLCFSGEDISQQKENIAGLITGRTLHNHIDKDRAFDFFDIKADLEAITACELCISENEVLQPGQRADILIDGVVVGYIGAIHPRITESLGLAQCYVFELVFGAITQEQNTTYQSFAHYQASSRDISLLISKDYEYNELHTSILKLKQEHLTTISLIDIWQDDSLPEGHHSLTFSLTYQANDKTLTDEEIDTAVVEIVTQFETTFSAKQR